VLFTMSTMARLMLTRSRNVTAMPRKNIRHSTYLAAIRSVDETVKCSNYAHSAQRSSLQNHESST
jgi:antitoxin component of RelBE/YafQ-DinJ toxin-antitoxin module